MQLTKQVHRFQSSMKYFRKKSKKFNTHHIIQEIDQIRTVQCEKHLPKQQQSDNELDVLRRLTHG